MISGWFGEVLAPNIDKARGGVQAGSSWIGRAGLRPNTKARVQTSYLEEQTLNISEGQLAVLFEVCLLRRCTPAPPKLCVMRVCVKPEMVVFLLASL